MLRRFATTALLLATATSMLLAAERANTPHLLGSCAVVKTTVIGHDTQLELKIRLTNPGAQPVAVERLTLLSPAPVPAQLLRAPILLSPNGNQEISQEFKLPTRLYDSWQRGVRASVLVEMRRDDGTRFHHMIRLNEKSPLRGE